MSNQQGTLYIVSTPIGNLEDITDRARRLLAEVDLVAAEDTRHSGKLLQHLGIKKTLFSLNEQNEASKIKTLLGQLQAGKSIALISDAGTPLVSDPGYQVVQAAHNAGLRVVPVPGACAAIAALSVAGLPTHAFIFEGFPPAKAGARKQLFDSLATDRRTLIFYESPHRIIESLQDMAASFGPNRAATVARELTKQFETIHQDSLSNLVEWIQHDPNQQKGEFVVLVHGNPTEQDVSQEVEHSLKILLAELPLKQAVSLTAKLTGAKKNEVYDRALGMVEKEEG